MIISEIVKWATENLKPWQRDALRRLFQKHDIDEADLNDLYAMLRSAHGLPDPQGREPLPLSEEQVPTAAPGPAPLILKAMRDLRNVNRIASGQTINFGPGLTVVYGPNASGKSGYARVLKRACRARDNSESVLPDATDRGGTAKEPEAMFDVEIGGQPKSLHWKHNSDAPPELSSVAVFDSHCARAFLDEGEAAYVPYGLDILENIASQVFRKLLDRLNAEISTVDVDSSPFQDFPKESKVGKIVAQLSETTDTEELRKLAEMSEAEQKRLGELEAVTKEADPAKKAKDLGLLEKRLTGLADRITAAAAMVDNNAIEKLKLLDEETEAAINAEKVAAESLSNDSQLLPGTGGSAWRSLFDAARRFSEEKAYPSHQFPHCDTDAQCVLCQQSLNAAAQKRLRKFDEFVRQEAAELADDRRKKRQQQSQQIRGQRLDFNYDKAISAEIEGIDPALHKMIADFGAGLESRQKWILKALETHNWDAAVELTNSPVESVRRRAENFAFQARNYEDASDPAKIAEARDEFSELQSRSTLKRRVPALLKLVDRMKTKARLETCREDLVTRAISTKAKDFSDQALSQELSSALSREFAALEVERVKTKLTAKNKQGKTLFRIVLDTPVAKNIETILSEGEQRAIAIGSFLAEMGLASGSNALVFDDPVSSLDHQRRQAVARRLVREADKRQIIIFTHDTVFLAGLLKAAEGSSLSPKVAHLEWGEDHPGHVTAGLPFEHQGVQDRLDKLEKEQRNLAPNWPQYPNESQRQEMRGAYSRLRATVERAIEEVVLNGAITRYDDWIRCGRLSDVVGFSQSEFKAIEKLHKTCCEFTDAHDHASSSDAGPPTPAGLLGHIEELKQVVSEIKARRKARKHAPPPSGP